MASIIQRILGLGFLMGSIAFGMTLARGQVDPKLGVTVAPNMPANLPPGLSAEQLEAARQQFEDQARANALLVQSQKEAASRAASSSGAPGFPGAPSASTPEKFVPSEVVVFQAAHAKHVEPRAIIHTTLGDVEIKLLSALAPKTVKNFMELARGDREFSDARTSKKTRRPFYNGLSIHKVVSGEYIQMGCPMGNGRGGPGYTIPDEIAPQLKFDHPFVVAMASAREGVKVTKDSNGSQFFITLRPQAKWDGQYSIFGEVTKGQKILQSISGVDVGPTDRPIRKVFITAIDIIDEEGGAHTPPLPTEMPAVSQPAPASVGPASVAPPIVAPAPAAAPAGAAPAPVAPPAAAPPGMPPAPSAPGGLAVPPQ